LNLESAVSILILECSRIFFALEMAKFELFICTPPSKIDVLVLFCRGTYVCRRILVIDILHMYLEKIEMPFFRRRGITNKMRFMCASECKN
jgi:hypothetical protein